MTKLLTALAVAGAALLLAASALAAAPRYIMVSGPGLSRPVLFDVWNENLALYVAIAEAPRATRSAAASVRRRPRLRLSLFWGWPEGQLPTRPSQGNQTGWFYPACRARRALVDLKVNGERVLRLAPKEVLDTFTAHGIPIRRTCPVRSPRTPSRGVTTPVDA
jgi:hypothetical protein